MKILLTFWSKAQGQALLQNRTGQLAEAFYSDGLLEHLKDSIPLDYTTSRRAAEGT